MAFWSIELSWSRKYPLKQAFKPSPVYIWTIGMPPGGWLLSNDKILLFKNKEDLRIYGRNLIQNTTQY